MRKIIRKLLPTLIIGLCTSSMANTPLNISGWYVDASIPFTSLDGSGSGNFSGTGFGLAGGYKKKVNNLYLGGELETAYLGDISNQSLYMSSLNVILGRHLSTRILAEAKIGMARENVEYSHLDGYSDFSPLVGISANYYFQQHISGFVSFEHLFGNSLNDAGKDNDPFKYNQFSLGARYTW